MLTALRSEAVIHSRLKKPTRLPGTWRSRPTACATKIRRRRSSFRWQTRLCPPAVLIPMRPRQSTSRASSRWRSSRSAYGFISDRVWGMSMPGTRSRFLAARFCGWRFGGGIAVAVHVRSDFRLLREKTISPGRFNRTSRLVATRLSLVFDRRQPALRCLLRAGGGKALEREVPRGPASTGSIPTAAFIRVCGCR